MGDEVTVSANPSVDTTAWVEMGSENAYVPSGIGWRCIAADRPAVLRIADAMEGDGDSFADCPGVAITVCVETGGLVDFAMTTVPLSALEAIVEQARARR